MQRKQQRSSGRGRARGAAGAFFAELGLGLGLLPAVPRLFFLARGRRQAPEEVSSDQVVLFVAAATLSDAVRALGRRRVMLALGSAAVALLVGGSSLLLWLAVLRVA